MMRIIESVELPGGKRGAGEGSLTKMKAAGRENYGKKREQHPKALPRAPQGTLTLGFYLLENWKSVLHNNPFARKKLMNNLLTGKMRVKPEDDNNANT